jgi:hypothetical protein
MPGAAAQPIKGLAMKKSKRKFNKSRRAAKMGPSVPKPPKALATEKLGQIQHAPAFRPNGRGA